MAQYKTILCEAEDAFIEKRSRFIGYAKPVQTEEEALAFIAEKKSKHWDASHNVYAYIIRGGVMRYSDDGEPQGTAGIPVLDVLQKSGVTDLVVVATRYFGGILLGGGGLVRAYSHSAAITCDAANILHMCECCPLTLRMDYTLYGKVTHILPKYGVIEVSSEFGSDVFLELNVRLEVLEQLKKDLTELSGGKIRMECGKQQFADFSSVG